MKEIPLEERVQARRSPIHGWGLFTLQSFAKNRTCFVCVHVVGSIASRKARAQDSV
jgi:hypothetical protein